MLIRLAQTLPAEQAHRAAILGLRAAGGWMPPAPTHANLAIDCGLGRKMPSPIGLAAGFDKDAEAIIGTQKLGFGAIEVGSITPQAQPGNPMPRVFRLREDQAVINRYGFNSQGSEAAVRQLNALNRDDLHVPLGVNLGKNKTSDALADYRHGLVTLAPLADYITINLSSPNTPGLRDQQNMSAMTALIDGLGDVWPDQPVFVKLAPDLDDADLHELVGYLADSPVTGIIMGNTTLSRPDSLRSSHATETGGLSGAPLFDLALKKLQLIAQANAKLPAAKQLTLIGCGGIDSAIRALQMIKAGASMVQLYSAIAIHGPGLVRRINADLSALLKQEGVPNIQHMIGVDLT